MGAGRASKLTMSESESEPDAYDVMSPGIEGELLGLIRLTNVTRSAKEEAI